MTPLEIYRISLTKEIQKKVNEKELLKGSIDYNHDELLHLDGQIRGLNQSLKLANQIVEQYI